MKKSIIILSILGVLVLPNLTHAIVFKSYYVKHLNTATATGTLLSNLANYTIIVDSIYYDLNTSVTNKELILSCGTTYATAEDFFWKGSNGVTNSGEALAWYVCQEGNIYYRSGPTPGSSTVAITNWTCTEFNECTDLQPNIKTQMSATLASSTISLVNYAGFGFETLFFGAGFLIPVWFMKRKK